MRTFLLLAAMAVLPACSTSTAQVPHIDQAAAHELVRSDLELFAQEPTTVHWRRAYRHFDQYLEPHLSSSERLELEVTFGMLRRQLKMGPPDELVASTKTLMASLQPQD